jgi:hypothetical protein
MSGSALSGKFKPLLLLAASLCVFPTNLMADDYVELKIPLENGRYLSLRGFCSECNRGLGTHYDLESINDRRVELTPAKRRLLKALAFEGVPSKRTDWKTLRDGTSEASVDLKPGSSFLTKLNQQQRPDSVRYHCGIGTRGFMTDEQYEKLLPQLDQILQKRGIPEIARSSVLGLLKQSDACRTGHGDGVVSIDSARIKGAASERTFDLNHLQFLTIPPNQDESDVTRWILETLKWK